MAQKVQPISIALNIKGAEKLAGLKSSFRDLGKTVNITDNLINNARKSINDYAKSANNSEAVIKGQIKAFEGLREQATMGGKVYKTLGNQIKQLKAELRGSSDAAEEQRVSLVKAGQAAKGSATEIKSVVLQLEQLQKNAVPGSSAFAKLGQDIAALKAQLKEANVEVKKFNVGFETGQRPAMSLEKIQRQVGRLTEGLKTLNFVSNDFANVQERIALLGQVQSGTIGRQQVIARERMFAGQAFESFAAGPAGSLQLPKTVAALNLEISELQDRLSNTVPGQAYANLTVEIANKQRELREVINGTADSYDKLAAAQDRSTRIAQKIADIQDYQISTGRAAPGVGGYRDPETGAMIARGRGQIADRAAYRKRGEAFAEGVVAAAKDLAAVPALPMAGTTTAPGTGAAISGGARQLTGQVEVTRGAPVPASFSAALADAARSRQARIPSAAVGVAPAVGLGEQVIKKQVNALREAATAFRPYNDSIRKARAANNGSISSINNLKNALIAKRNELPTTSAAFRRLSREIEDLDRKSEKASRRMSRRRMSPMQMTQAAGAAISGGIFGGPEGFLGGAIGAIGGVGGAFAGAAVGAQIGGLRRQLGEFADYAAQISRLEIALKGITEVQNDVVASQTNYNRAIAAAADVTKELNVPQEVAIQGITRLAAAVKGAGGSVADAELAFKNINSAIIATGGGAEQVQGAVTALVQIFSKGKVSAEEINQIAERLPGTFNKIAAASGRTGPELTKALQDGKVGLNDLMKFLVSLGDEYGELAERIAGSSENAGARLQIAFNQMRIEVGEALQPIGAEFQDVFTEFIKDITPALVAVLPKIGEFVLALASALDPSKSLALEIGGVAAAVFLLKKAVDAYIGSKFAGIITTQIGLLKAMGAQIHITAAAQNVLNASSKAFGLALKALPLAIVAGGLLTLIDRLKETKRVQKEVNDLINDGSVAQINAALATNERTLAEIQLQRTILQATPGALGGFAKGAFDVLDKAIGRSEALKNSILILKGQLTEGMIGGGVLPYDDESSFKDKPDGGDSGASKIASAIANAEGLRLQLGRTLEDLRSKIAGVGDTAIEAIARRYADALRKADDAAADNIAKIVRLEKQSGKSYDDIRADIEEVRLASRRLAEEAALDAIGKEFAQSLKDAQQPLNDLMLDFNTQIAERARIQELMSQGMSESLAKEIANIETIASLEKEKLDVKILDLQATIAKLDPEKEITKELKEQLRVLQEARGAIPERKEKAITGAKSLEEKKDTPGDIIARGFKNAQDELEKLTNLGNIAVNSANMIGDAFGKAFADVVTGSATAREALAGMMQSIGQSFIQMAAQIIAKQTTMIILGSIAKALGIMGGAAGASSSTPAQTLPDAPVQSGLGLNINGVDQGIAPIGVAANGSPVRSGRPYLVGERGPELFVPGATGRIDTNRDLAQMMGRSPAASRAPSLNFTFETTNIGGTDFVSREQLEEAMLVTRRQAAADGAKRGMGMTLDKIQNSPRTRSRIGVR